MVLDNAVPVGNLGVIGAGARGVKTSQTAIPEPAYVLPDRFPHIFSWPKRIVDVEFGSNGTSKTRSLLVQIHCGSHRGNSPDQLGIVVSHFNGHEKPLGTILKWCPAAPLDIVAAFHGCTFAQLMPTLDQTMIMTCYMTGRGVREQADEGYAEIIANEIGYNRYRAIMERDIPNLREIVKRYYDHNMIITTESAQHRAL